MQKNKKTTKLNQSHTHTTPRFKWFPQYEVHPMTEAITIKFTMKMEYKIVERKIHSEPKVPIHPNLTITQ
jgi:hypothetical protein